MIEAGFESEKKALCIKFNGWRFQGFEDAKIALIEGIVTGLIEKRPALTKAGDAVKDVFRRIDWLKVAKKAGGLAFTAFTGIPTLDQIQVILGHPGRRPLGSSQVRHQGEPGIRHRWREGSSEAKGRRRIHQCAGRDQCVPKGFRRPP
jgi:hypothetical protein